MTNEDHEQAIKTLYKMKIMNRVVTGLCFNEMLALSEMYQGKQVTDPEMLRDKLSRKEVWKPLRTITIKEII